MWVGESGCDLFQLSVGGCDPFLVECGWVRVSVTFFLAGCGWVLVSVVGFG